MQNGDIFALNPSELGASTMVQHTIDTGNNEPIRQQAYWILFALRAKVDNMTTEMLGQGIIRPSLSPWASPFILSWRRMGQKQFCVDYRKLSAVTK